MKSIQRRLSLGLASVLIVVGLILAQSSLWLFDHSLRRYLQEDLKDETQTLLVALVRGQNGVQLDERRLDPTFQRPFSGHYFRIDFADETWRSHHALVVCLRAQREHEAADWMARQIERGRATVLAYFDRRSDDPSPDPAEDLTP